MSAATAGPAPRAGAGPVLCDIYLRLSDARYEEAFSGREDRLRKEAARRGWDVAQVVTENDLREDGSVKPASAWKKRRIRTPGGRVQLRVIRPVFRAELDRLAEGRIHALLAEDLDRVVRDPRDMEDLIEACELSGGSAASVSGSLQLTEGGTAHERSNARTAVNYAAKASEDTARRVRERRAILAGQSWAGGPRPYGFQVERGTEKYHRNLVVDEAEAAELRRVYADVLDRGISLAACARDLRQRRVPTVRGGPWSAEILSHVLRKPAIAGLAVKEGELVPAPWPAIVPRERWEALCRLADEWRGRNGNEPKWLLSGFARCGVCQATVKVNGRASYGTSYQCRAAQHVRRAAAALDQYVSQTLCAVLDRDDRGELLRPAPADPEGAAAARARRARLKAIGRARRDLLDMQRLGEISRAELSPQLRALAEEAAVIERALASTGEADPLAEFRPAARGGRTARQVWDSLDVARRRAVAQVMLTAVTINRAPGRGGAPGAHPIDEAVELAGNGWTWQGPAAA
jgi:site-specific DNA recombinase